MMKTFSILFGSSLLVGGMMLGNCALPASAVEMFTNFNNGMELGFRPYGIPEFPPVRYHSWQPHGWYERHGISQPSGIGDGPPPSAFDYGAPAPRPRTVVPAPSVPGNQSQNDGPIRLQAEPVAAITASLPERDDFDWVRGEDFLPRDR